MIIDLEIRAGSTRTSRTWQEGGGLFVLLRRLILHIEYDNAILKQLQQG